MGEPSKLTDPVSVLNQGASAALRAQGTVQSGPTAGLEAGEDGTSGRKGTAQRESSVCPAAAAWHSLALVKEGAVRWGPSGA